MRNKPKCDTWDGQPALFAHAKLDGIFATITKTVHGVVYAVSSNSNDITDLVKRAPQYEALHTRVPCGVELYCEITAKGRPASHVKSHDVELEVTGLGIGNLHANAYLWEVNDLFTLWGVPFAPWEQLFGGWEPNALMQKYIAMGYEGVVLKDGNVLNWRRLKPKRTADLIVIGWKPGNGKHTGKVGSLLCGVCRKGTAGVYTFHEVAYVGGMTDEERDTITANIHRCVFEHHVVEVEYQEVASNGGLRHPRFVRFRDDKHWTDCDGSDIYGERE